jgi:hypothetical protein
MAKKKNKQGLSSGIYVGADARTITVKLSQSNAGEVLKLCGAANHYLSTDYEMDTFIEDSIAHYFKVLNQLVLNKVKEEQDGKTTKSEESSGVETEVQLEQESTDSTALADKKDTPSSTDNAEPSDTSEWNGPAGAITQSQ